MLRKKIFGLVLGLSLFLLFYSSLFMFIPGFPLIFMLPDPPANFSTIVWFIIIILFPIFLLLFIAIMSMRLGLIFSHYKTFPKLNWLKTIVASIISILLAIFIPYLITMAELRWKSHIVPIYPNASGLEIHIYPIFNKVVHSFDTKDSEANIVTFFITELEEKCTLFKWWEKYNQASFNCSEYDEDYIGIKFTAKKKENKVEVTYGPDYFNFPNAFILFITITAFIYANIKIKRNDENYNEDE